MDEYEQLKEHVYTYMESDVACGSVPEAGVSRLAVLLADFFDMLLEIEMITKMRKWERMETSSNKWLILIPFVRKYDFGPLQRK